MKPTIAPPATRLLLQVGDGDPIELGQVDLPVSLGGSAQYPLIRFQPRRWRRNLRRLLRGIARAI